MVLEEIGGVELLNLQFISMLDAAFKTDIPILGVIKWEGPASALIAALGLSIEYEQTASKLRQQLLSDPNTQVYHCGQFDEKALLLAKQWTEEFL